MSAPQQNNQPNAAPVFGTTTGNTGTSTTTPSFSLNTGSNSSSLFGNTGSGTSFFSNPTSSGSLFGKPTTPTTGAPSSSAPGTAPSLFGGTTTSTLPTSASSIFGKAASPAPGVPSSTAPGASLGGVATGTTPTTTAANAAGSSFFSIPPASSGQSIFGNLGGTGAPAPATSKPTSFVPLTPSATTNPPMASSTTSFSANTTKDTQGKDGTSTTFPSAAPTSGLFSAVPPKSDNAEKKDAPSAAPSFNLFGGKDKEIPFREQEYTGPGLFGAKPGAAATTGGGATTLTGSTLAPKDGDKAKDATSPSTSIVVAPPSVLKGKTIEEIVNKWSSELENQVREFNKFAAEVTVWDRALMENGNNLAALYSHVVAVEREQTEIEQTLDHVEQQQRDLSATLDAYERSTEEILGTQGGSLRSLDTGPADTERDKNYVLATELHAHLDDLSTSLTQMIDSVNTLSLSATNGSSPRSGDDPMMQISQILNTHLESLQWIDGAVREVEGKVTEVERRVKDAGMGNSLGERPCKAKGLWATSVIVAEIEEETYLFVLRTMFHGYFSM
ncbi:Nsp1-like C-terminal region-domain-containing protein [Pisolithus marmoratus]|nr:Nsp1-like C-terminal region-domain-containing protein [Pisolithus marmoratus]